MTTGIQTGITVGRKRKDSRSEFDDYDEDEPLTGSRVEFQASERFVARLKRAAKVAGMGVSAYVRQACNQKMDEDAKRRGGD